VTTPLDAATLPANESQRLLALARYQILDTPPDGAFDRITELAATLLEVPIAIVSLVDRDRIWFKSSTGVAISQVSREPGLCASAVLSPGLYQVCDAQLDARALANPLVTGELGLRFYAAVPLQTHDGFNLGTLCVVGREPRQLTPAETAILTSLAALVMDQMELRLAARKIAELERVQQALNDQLQKTNRAYQESEEQFRDLFVVAPIPYVYEGLDSRFIRANRAALELLGLAPSEVATTFGRSLLADSPENEQRLRQAFATIKSGGAASGVVLELRRKDSGKPLWVEWWSKPAPSGEHTRTVMLDITERVLLEREQARLLAQNVYLNEEILTEYNFGAVIGESAALQNVMRQAELVAPTEASVLINGESGTGKELIARAIHEQSRRKGRIVVKVNCSAIPDSLFESEFFGHVRGAFTGAVKDKPGRFELAEGGTLFLDEVGELPLSMQGKLLRVLQEREIERVGDTKTRKVDVRIIAATNRDLRKEVDAGRFRQDLFYRLSVFPIEVPPLRARQDDIPLLATHFARKSAQQVGRPAPQITLAAMSQLCRHDWPGNIRELQNVVERAVIVCQGGPLQFALPEPRTVTVPDAAPDLAKAPSLLTREALKSQERENIVHALSLTGGKVFGPGGAAELLHMKPTTLASRIRSLRISGALSS